MSITPRGARLFTDIFTGLVVASIGVALAGLTWRIAGFAGGATPAIAPVAPPAAAPADPQAAIALAPFGRETGADAPPTSLALELRGILLTAPRERSSALIAPTGGKPLAYAIGGSVAGATIEDIAVDRVILRVNGRLESLSFPKAGAQAAAAPAGGAEPSSDSPAGPSDAPPPLQAIAPAAPPAGGGPDMASLLGATATDEGYRVGTPSASAARLGLQAGDIITGVNGVALGDPDRDRQTIAAAQAAGSARVELTRDGQRITLSLPLR